MFPGPLISEKGEFGFWFAPGPLILGLESFKLIHTVDGKNPAPIRMPENFFWGG